MRPSDTETSLLSVDGREALLAEVDLIRDNPRRDVAKLETLFQPLKSYAKNWLADKHAADDAFLARLIATLIRCRSTHAFLLKQDGFENKPACVVALANLIHGSESEEWEAWDAKRDRRVTNGEEWLAAVLRGLFCFHFIFPRVHGKMSDLFRIDRPRDLPKIFDRVLEHYDLFLTELQKLRAAHQALVDVSSAELADTIKRLTRLREKFPQTTIIRRRLQFSPMALTRGGKR